MTTNTFKNQTQIEAFLQGLKSSGFLSSYDEVLPSNDLGVTLDSLLLSLGFNKRHYRKNRDSTFLIYEKDGIMIFHRLFSEVLNADIQIDF